MASTDYGVGHPMAVKLYSKKLSYEVTGELYFSKFTSEGSDSLVQEKTETKKSAGDRITYALRGLPSGAGVLGDNTAEGQAEPMLVYSDALLLDQLRQPFESGGRISEQRVPFEVREELRLTAKDWWLERMNVIMMNHLSGFSAETDLRFAGHNVITAPSVTGGVTRFILGNGVATEAALVANAAHAIKLTDLDRCSAIAKVQKPRMRPVRVGSKNMHVAFLHPYAITAMRQDAATAGNFFDVQKAQLQGGKISDNPIITGAEFIYNNTIVHESSYLPNTIGNANNVPFRRGVFCGAQALTCGYGRENGIEKMQWVEKLFDFDNRFGVLAGMIFGVKKTVYNTIDFGSITLAGYAPAP